MKKAKWYLKYFVILVCLTSVIAFVFGPKYFDKDKNTTTFTGKVAANPLLDSIPFIADLHCDALLWDRNILERHNYGHVDIPRMQETNMAFQVFTIVSKVPAGINIVQNDANATDKITQLNLLQLQPINTWFSVKNRVLNQCDRLHKFAEKSKGDFRVITTRQELKQYVIDRKKNKKLTAGMLGIEGAHCLDNDLNSLDEFYKKGVRYIGLAHFFDNEWAGSAHGMTKGGLTEKGKLLIKKTEKLNITIDLAHSSEQTITDVLAIHKGPVLVSHTGVKGICNNQRNLSDAQIIEIGKHNGLIGIGLWETAVCGTDATATAKNIKYVANLIGTSKVGLGSDWDGSVQAHFAVTGLPLMVTALQKEGFSKEDIYKIMGGNIRDFFLNNLPE